MAPRSLASWWSGAGWPAWELGDHHCPAVKHRHTKFRPVHVNSVDTNYCLSFFFYEASELKMNNYFYFIIFLPFCYLRQNITIKRAPVSLFPLSHISWMLSQEDAISFSQTLTCSVFRELNVKAVSLYCSATAQSSDGEGTKWILQSEGFHGWDGTHSSQKHRKRNSDSVRVWTS